MALPDVPEVRFDETVAIPIFPRPVPKMAVLVPIPTTSAGDDESELPTFIKPEWGGVQVFYGDYYGIVVDGVVVYGSAKDQWEAMHTQVKPELWVKTAVPTAYQATEACRIVTLVPTDDGNVREADYTLELGDWIVRQPGGEVQHIKLAKYDGIYYSRGEAEACGLDHMTPEEFAAWAVEQVRATVGAS